jgi:CBS domain-containing protein
MLVSQILKIKGDRVSTASPDDTLAAAAGRLNSEKIGALMVTDDGRVVGVLSERDIVSALAERGPAALESAVRDCMTADVIVARPTETVDVLLARMTDRRVRHLPVVHEDKLCGVVSIGDLVKHKISEVEAEAQGLKAYIAAG